MFSGVLRICFAFFIFIRLCVAHELSYKKINVFTDDGVRLEVAEFEGNENGRVLLIQPGLIETFKAFDGMIRFFYNRGYKVFVMHSRHVGDEDMKSSGKFKSNGEFKKLLVQDPSAVWRHLIGRADEIEARTGKRPEFHVVGHSQGGMQELAVLNVAELKAEFGPEINTLVLLTTPIDLSELPVWLRSVAWVSIPLLRVVERLTGKEELNFHHRMWKKLREYENHRNFFVRKSASLAHRAVRGLIVRTIVNPFLINKKLTTKEEARRLVESEISELPTKNLRGIAIAAARGKLPVPTDPEEIENRTLVISATNDILAPPAEQTKLVARLTNAKQVRHVVASNTSHEDATISQKMENLLYTEMAEFMENPDAFAQNSYFQFDPTMCVRALNGY